MPEDYIPHYCTMHGLKRPCKTCMEWDRDDGKYFIEGVKKYIIQEFLE